MPDVSPDLGEIRFRRRRDAGDVLNATVRFIRANARELARSYLLVVLPVALASGVATALWYAQMGDLLADPAAFAGDPLAVFNGTYAGVMLFGLLGSALTLAAAGAYIRLYREGQAGSITAGDLWEETKGLILPFIGLPLAYSLAMILAMPIFIVPCLGAIAWLALAVWLLPHAAVTLAVRTLERPTLMGAWRRARDLVKGAWGFAFGAIALAGIVFLVLIVVLSIPISVAGELLALNSAEGPAGEMALMGILFAPLQVLSYTFYLIPLVAAFFIHGRLVEDLDGTSLFSGLDAIAAEAGTARASTPPTPQPTPPRSTPPPDAPADGSDDAPSGGFRGGGFRG